MAQKSTTINKKNHDLLLHVIGLCYKIYYNKDKYKDIKEFEDDLVVNLTPLKKELIGE